MRALTLILLLFSLSAFLGLAAFSDSGLEGWGKEIVGKVPKEGVVMYIQDYSKIDENYPIKAIRTKVELRLLQAGIKVTDRQTGYSIFIDALPIEVGGRIVGYAVRVAARRDVEFQALDNGKLVTYSKTATVAPYSGIAPDDGLVKFIGNAEKRIKEDYLRILRYIRFYLNYSKQKHSEELKKTIRKNINGIAKISSDRLLDEIKKLVLSEGFLTLPKDNFSLEIINLVIPQLKNLKFFKNSNYIQKN